jgi:hypothetical protein
MKRRELLALLTGIVALWPLGAAAQVPGKQYRIAFVHPSFPVAGWRERPLFRAVLAELRRLGYAEGQNLVAEYDTAEGHVAFFMGYENVVDHRHAIDREEQLATGERCRKCGRTL